MTLEVVQRGADDSSPTKSEEKCFNFWKFSWTTIDGSNFRLKYRFSIIYELQNIRQECLSLSLSLSTIIRLLQD